VLGALALAGCASTQLNFNTLDVADTVSDLYTKQVLSNLSKFIDNQYAIPSMIDLSAGTIQTTNSVTPSVTAPLGHTVVRGPSAAVTSTSLAGSGLSVSAADSWQQNWNVAPVNDADTLRNMQAVYRYVVWNSDIVSEYHVPQIRNGSGNPIDDPFAYQEPHCVKCKKADKSYINPALTPPGWLYWKALPAATQADRLPLPGVPTVGLGIYGNYYLLMTQKDYYDGRLSKFVFFMLPVASPTSPSKGTGFGVRNATPAVSPATQGIQPLGQ
jgi:hypothetical protein